jgi:hypothetical protein
MFDPRHGISVTAGCRRYCQVERELWLPEHEEDNDRSLEGRALIGSLDGEFIYGLGEKCAVLH